MRPSTRCMPGSERPTNAAARRYPESPSFSHGEVQHTHSPHRSQAVCLSRQQFSIWRSTGIELGGRPPHDNVARQPSASHRCRPKRHDRGLARQHKVGGTPARRRVPQSSLFAGEGWEGVPQNWSGRRRRKRERVVYLLSCPCPRRFFLI